MKKSKIKLHLKKLHWEILSTEIKKVFVATPIKEWALHSWIISELYINKKMFFDIYPHTSKGVDISLTMVQAIAVNEYMAAHCDAYNDLLRLEIEPKLILG